jgi:methionine-rich copper-binding protein CopC
VKRGTKRLVVFVAPGRAATAEITLVDPRGRVVYRRQRPLAAGTTRLVVPLPRRAIAGTYTVNVVAKAGPVAGTARFHVRLTAAKPNRG